MSDDDWDNDDFEVPDVPVPKFEDEDKEPEKVEVTSVPKVSKYASMTQEELVAELEKRDKEGKPKSQLGAKARRKLLKEREAAERAERQRELELLAEEQQEQLTPEEIYARKLAVQQQIEDADLELAKDLLGDDNGDKVVLIEAMNPETLEDFQEMAKKIITKATKYESSPYFSEFVTTLSRDLCLSLQPTDISKVSRGLEVLRAEKQKAITGNKKKKKDKPSIASGKGSSGGGGRYDDSYVDEYDDFM
eukprot:m.42363 g.42363  ORF g.42363 m.42363 type:complete len:249 (-) comp9874_c0_seq1:148-894(-)